MADGLCRMSQKFCYIIKYKIKHILGFVCYFSLESKMLGSVDNLLFCMKCINDLYECKVGYFNRVLLSVKLSTLPVIEMGAVSILLY